MSCKKNNELNSFSLRQNGGSGGSKRTRHYFISSTRTISSTIFSFLFVFANCMQKMYKTGKKTSLYVCTGTSFLILISISISIKIQKEPSYARVK